MKLFNNNRSFVRQNEKDVSKPQKHDANLQKNSTLFFQVGLIVALLGAYGLLQLNFKYTEALVSDRGETVTEDSYVMDLAFKIYKEPEAKPVEKKATSKPKLLLEPKIVDNNASLPETDNLITEPEPTDTPLDPGSIEVIEIPVDVPPMPVNAVEEAPVFPGCEKVNGREERIKCLSDKINQHIRKKFDANLGSKLGLDGIQRINVMFTIDTNGNVVGIKALSKHKELDEEAVEVMGKLPKMQPGRQNEKPVKVSYTFPIIFQVRD